MLNDIFRYSMKVLTEKRFRAILTIIGIAIGPLALVMMTSTVRGYAGFIEQSILTLGQNTVVILPSEKYRLSASDIDFIRGLDEVSDADPFYSTQGFVQTAEGRRSVFMYAVDAAVLLKAIGNLEMESGEFPTDTELTYCVVGHSIAYSTATDTKVYDVGDVITLNIVEVVSGGKVNVRKVSVRVKGILKEFGGAAFVSPDQSIFLPVRSGPALLNIKDMSGIFIIAKDPSLVDSLTRRLRSTYQDKVTIVAFQQIARTVSSVTGALDFIVFSASLSAFAVAVAGTASTMITSVIERTRAVGVLKALGFTDRQVVTMIFAEAVIMSLIGGSIGITLGVVGAHALASRGLSIAAGSSNLQIVANPEITAGTIITTVLITIMVGIAGGILPAFRAAKIPPAVALRYE
ncbi:MAG: ABC transporter permease [Zestosphaera sp.]